MEQPPKLVYFTRVQFARLSSAKQAMDDIVTSSIAGAGGTALGTYFGGGKVELILPLLAGLLGMTARIIRNQLAFYMSIAILSDPITEKRNP